MLNFIKMCALALEEISKVITFILKYFVKRDYLYTREVSGQTRNKKVHVLGNSPNLTKTLSLVDDVDDVLMVNFSVNDDLFFTIKPKYLCIADPVFFENKTGKLKEKVDFFYNRLESVDWDLNIIVPSTKHKDICINNNKINVMFINTRYVDIKSNRLRFSLYEKNRACPNAINVIILSLYTLLQEAYKEIYLHGVDGDGYLKYRVNKENEIYYTDNHFYDPDSEGVYVNISKENRWINHCGMLHSVLNDEVIMHKSFSDVSKYANYLNANIVNVNPNSLIDSFSRDF